MFLLHRRKQFRDLIPTLGLVAYWPFEVDFTDSVGSNDGTAINGASITSNTLYLVRASSQRVDLANSSDWNFGTGDFSISLWLKQSTVSILVNAFAYYTTVPIQFYINASNYVGLYAGSDIFSGTTSVGGKVGTWWLLTYSRIGNSWKIYADTVEIDSATDSRSLDNPAHSNGTMIGAEVTAPSQYFNGFIGRFRIYKGYGLTAADVAAIYDTEKSIYGL